MTASRVKLGQRRWSTCSQKSSSLLAAAQSFATPNAAHRSEIWIESSTSRTSSDGNSTGDGVSRGVQSMGVADMDGCFGWLANSAGPARCLGESSFRLNLESRSIVLTSLARTVCPPLATTCSATKQSILLRLHTHSAALRARGAALLPDHRQPLGRARGRRLGVLPLRRRRRRLVVRSTVQQL